MLSESLAQARPLQLLFKHYVLAYSPLPLYPPFKNYLMILMVQLMFIKLFSELKLFSQLSLFLVRSNHKTAEKQNGSEINISKTVN